MKSFREIISEPLKKTSLTNIYFTFNLIKLSDYDTPINMEILISICTLIVQSHFSWSLYHCSNTNARPVPSLDPVLFDDFVRPFTGASLCDVQYSYTLYSAKSTEDCYLDERREFAVHFGQDRGILVARSTDCKFYTFWRDRRGFVVGNVGLLNFTKNSKDSGYNFGFFLHRDTSRRVYYVHELLSDNISTIDNYSNCNVSNKTTVELFCKKCPRKKCSMFATTLQQFNEEIVKSQANRKFIILIIFLMIFVSVLVILKKTLSWIFKVSLNNKVWPIN